MENLKDYNDCYTYLSARFERVGGAAFYSELFPNNENAGEKHMDYSHPNAVYIYRDEHAEGKQMRRKVMLNDTWAEDYKNFVQGNSLALCGGLSYRGRTNKLEHAQRMQALIFDLDGVGLNELQNLFLRVDGDPTKVRRLPLPTFLALSGTGLHLYYFFSEPIDLYPNIKLQLKRLKYDLTFRMWDYKGTSKQEEIQYQSINQSFRMIGSKNEKYGNEIVAFRVGEPVSLAYLNAYADKEENRVDVNKPFRPSKMTREQAKESYPEWYQRVVVEGNKRQKKWDIAGKVHGNDPYALYHWWLRQIGQVKGGHRYFFCLVLSVVATKCSVSKKQLKEDVYAIFNDLRKIQHENEFTREDIDSALEAYDKEYYNFTIDDMVAVSGIPIQKNKRNGRKQKEHLARMRAVEAVDYPNGEWRKGNGRHTKQEKVTEWRKKHPDETKTKCQRETGLSHNTVKKWWDTEKIKKEG